jgi:hypothetical protein
VLCPCNNGNVERRTQAFVVRVVLGLHLVFLDEPPDWVLWPLIQPPTCPLDPVRAELEGMDESGDWFGGDGITSTVFCFPGAPNGILCNRPPSSSLASTILKLVIPFSLRVLAAMIPETPPPKMSTDTSSVPGLAEVPIPSAGGGIYKERRRLSSQLRPGMEQGDDVAYRLTSFKGGCG